MNCINVNCVYWDFNYSLHVKKISDQNSSDSDIVIICFFFRKRVVSSVIGVKNSNLTTKLWDLQKSVLLERIQTTWFPLKKKPLTVSAR